MNSKDRRIATRLFLQRCYSMEDKMNSKDKRIAIQKGEMKDGDKDWNTPCEVCGQKPTMHPTGLCGPCCTGEAETLGGNW